jgi:hypothetical protein
MQREPPLLRHRLPRSLPVHLVSLQPRIRRKPIPFIRPPTIHTRLDQRQVSLQYVVASPLEAAAVPVSAIVPCRSPGGTICTITLQCSSWNSLIVAAGSGNTFSLNVNEPCPVFHPEDRTQSPGRSSRRKAASSRGTSSPPQESPPCPPRSDATAETQTTRAAAGAESRSTARTRASPPPASPPAADTRCAWKSPRLNETKHRPGEIETPRRLPDKHTPAVCAQQPRNRNA